MLSECDARSGLSVRQAGGDEMYRQVSEPFWNLGPPKTYRVRGKTSDKFNTWSQRAKH